MRVWYSLYDRLLHPDVLEIAFKKVKSSNGAPGIDGQSCKGFALNRSENIAELLGELRTKAYRPSPVKRVEIERPDGGIRLIGIPTVRDRVVQQALKMAIEPIFDAGFHSGSYGYRPNRSAHGAIAEATARMREEGLEYVVDMDLSIRIKAKLKAITRRNTPVNLAKVIRDLNPVLRGFVNYFRVANCKTELKKLMSWLRRRLRAIQMTLWKKPQKLHRRLRQLGCKGEFKRIKMASWRNASCQLAHMAMPNRWFNEIGLYPADQVETGTLSPLSRG